MGARTLISRAEFDALPEEERYEVDFGELVPMTAPKRRQTEIQWKVHRLLSAAVLDRGLDAEVHVEAPYEICAEPFTLLRPDISLIAGQRVKDVAGDEYMRGAPDLAVEVMSPSDTVERLYRKVAEYLAGGARSVGVVSPENRQVHWYSGRQAVVYGAGHSISEPELFGDYRFRVEAIF
jgi:Uma2 family endonuclease